MSNSTTATSLFLRCPDCGETVTILAQRDREGLPYLEIEHPGPWCPSIAFDVGGRQPPFPGCISPTEHDSVWLGFQRAPRV